MRSFSRCLRVALRVLIVFLWRLVLGMAELARDAFVSRNYRLAAEVYERCVKDPKGCSLELRLGYADSLAKCGRLREALDAYSVCYLTAPTVSSLSPEHLRHLVAALSDTVMSAPLPKSAPTPTPPAVQHRTPAADPLACCVCEDVLNQPVTLLCGHSVCRACEHKDRTRVCRRCGQTKAPHALETNVMIKGLIEKCWPVLLRASVLKEEGNQLFQKGDLQEALVKYDEAIELAPEHCAALNNRSHVLLRLNRPQAALEDAELACRLRPAWGKVGAQAQFRRAAALMALGHHDEAFEALCSCLALDRNPAGVRHDIATVLHCLLQPHPSSRGSRLAVHATRRGASHHPYWRERGVPGSHVTLRSAPRGLSDCEGSSGEEEEEEQCPPRHRQLQGIRAAHLQSSNPRLRAALDRIVQTTEKMKRPGCGGEEAAPGWVARASQGGPEAADLECVLCCRLLWRPVTTPCGHTYCWTCLDRCLDYSHACPLCMAPLAEYLSSNQRSVTEYLEEAARTLLPAEWSARQALHDAELTAAREERNSRVPVFVCTTAFPTVPCPLFVFEPRYRLMVRRAVESGDRQFGIAACVDQHAIGQKRYAEFGTMLEIRDQLCMATGCSVLATVGRRRFHVLEGGEMDGYDLARVEFLQDETVSAEALPGLQRLHDSVRLKAEEWVQTLAPGPQAEVNQTFGAMPELEEDWHVLQDGPAWAWWLLAILPLGQKLKVGILGTTSLEKRLRAIAKTLDHVTRQLAPPSRPAEPSPRPSEAPPQNPPQQGPPESANPSTSDSQSDASRL